MKISKVEAYPLSIKLKSPQVTSQGSYKVISICLIRIITDTGIEGVGECLARFAPTAYAELVTKLFAPAMIGEDPASIGFLRNKLRKLLNGRSGGILFEALAGVDIALWDILGKSLDTNIGRLLGGMNRLKVPAYASSIMVDKDVQEEGNRLVEMGFKTIKLKMGGTVKEEIRRTEKLRLTVGESIKIVTDANYIYTEYEAEQLARGLAEYDVTWLEEPIEPENREGYKRLAKKSPIAIAAGESEFTAHDFTDLVSTGSVQYVQPDVTRAGGITGSKSIATLANSFHLAYAPHVGFSGIICVAATLQLSSAMPNLFAYECMFTANPFRDELAIEPVGLAKQLKDGYADVPQTGGLGIQIDWNAVKRLQSL